MPGDAETQLAVGVLGATGYIGTPYREEIREAPGARIVALCSRRRHLLEQAGRDDGADLITDDWRAVVEHPDVDFVLVATPDAAALSAERGGWVELAELGEPTR